MGSDRPLVLDIAALEARMSEFRVQLDLARVGIASGNDLVGMLQNGGDDLRAITQSARTNSDDNGYVEFAAPKALYLDSQDANLTMLQGDRDDPLQALRPLVRTTEEEDAFRLAMIRRWVIREEIVRARKAAGYLRRPESSEQAHALLADANGR